MTPSGVIHTPETRRARGQAAHIFSGTYFSPAPEYCAASPGKSHVYGHEGGARLTLPGSAVSCCAVQHRARWPDGGCVLIRLDGGLGLEGARETSRQRRPRPLPTQAGSGPKVLPGSLSFRRRRAAPGVQAPIRNGVRCPRNRVTARTGRVLLRQGRPSARISWRAPSVTNTIGSPER